MRARAGGIKAVYDVIAIGGKRLCYVVEILRFCVRRQGGHAQVAGDLGGQLPRLDQPESVANLGVCKGLPAPAEVLADGPMLGHRVGDPTACDFRFHWGQSGHDS